MFFKNKVIKVDLGLEFAAKGEISDKKRKKAIATTILLFPSPYFGVPLMIIINLPGDNIVPGQKFDNPNDNSNVRINYDRIWEE